MLLPGLFSNNNYPGEYAHLAQDSDAVLNDRAYDAFNVVAQQSLSQNVSLASMLTTSHRTSPKLTETLTIAGRYGTVRSSLDSHGSLTGSLATSLLVNTKYQSATKLRLTGDVRPLETEKSRKLLATGRAEVHLDGGDYSATALYSLPGGIMAGSYLQGLGEKLAVGCEVVRPPRANSHSPIGTAPSLMAAAGIRYTNISKERNSEPGIIATLQANTEKTASASFLAQLPGEIAVAAAVNADFCNIKAGKSEDLGADQLGPPKLLSGLKRTRMSASAGFTKLLKNSQVTVNCNTQGEVCCNVRHAMQDGTVTEVIGSVDVLSGRATVGFGLVLSESTLPRFAGRLLKRSSAPPRNRK